MKQHKRGDIRADGYLYSGHNKFGDVWRSPQGWHKCAIARTFTKAKERAGKLGIAFDIDVEYLHSIYPEDGCCPIFKTKLEWGQTSGRNSSPSLDRKDPTKGYVKGNVAFISNRANRIKSDASSEELERILFYINK